MYVLVVDGCRPDEIDATTTPRLAQLRDDGTAFPAARALPVAETLLNHVMMMTGVRPDRSGVPANTVYTRGEGVVRTLDRPSDLRFPTVLEQLRDQGLTTGTVLSKDYLFGMFGERATYRWEPFPLLPVTDHAPDVATVDASSPWWTPPTRTSCSPTSGTSTGWDTPTSPARRCVRPGRPPSPPPTRS